MIKTSIYAIVCLILVAVLASSCISSTQPPNVTTPSTPSVSPQTPANSLPATEPNSTSSTSPAPSSTSVNRVDIVYFHPKVRCASCISIELRTRAVIEDSFKDAVDSGTLNFLSYELQDQQNASIVKKYGAASSQLFITVVKDNTETIKHVEEVWMPNLLKDGVAFDEFMRKLISESLEEVS